MRRYNDRQIHQQIITRLCRNCVFIFFSFFYLYYFEKTKERMTTIYPYHYHHLRCYRYGDLWNWFSCFYLLYSIFFIQQCQQHVRQQFIIRWNQLKNPIQQSERITSFTRNNMIASSVPSTTSSIRHFFQFSFMMADATQIVESSESNNNHHHHLHDTTTTSLDDHLQQLHDSMLATVVRDEDDQHPTNDDINKYGKKLTWSQKDNEITFAKLETELSSIPTQRQQQDQQSQPKEDQIHLLQQQQQHHHHHSQQQQQESTTTKITRNDKDNKSMNNVTSRRDTARSTATKSFLKNEQQNHEQQQQHTKDQEQEPDIKTLPHILFIVMDDLGSHDLGIHDDFEDDKDADDDIENGGSCNGGSLNSQDGTISDNGSDCGIHTPHIDLLATSGIYLSNYYVLPYCSPTRAAILSGRYPLHTGVHGIIHDISTVGLPLDEEIIPQVLRSNNNNNHQKKKQQQHQQSSSVYRTHGIGKWHVGHSAWEQTPTYRGFQSFFGYYVGAEDYYEHTNYEGYNMRYDPIEFCGIYCSQNVNERGNYSTHIFTRETIRVIKEHASYTNKQQHQHQHQQQQHVDHADMKTTFTGQRRRQQQGQTQQTGKSSSREQQQQQQGQAQEPLFLYVAYQAVHYPDQVPDPYRQLYENYTHWNDVRKKYAGMLTAADESIGLIIQALQQQIEPPGRGTKKENVTTMWDNTLVIFTTDNGGPTAVCSVQGSSNGIRKGGKCSVWEGGTVGDAIISGPYLRQLQVQKSSGYPEDATTTPTNHHHVTPRRLQGIDEKKLRPRGWNKIKSKNYQGMIYPNLFHAVDWLPTLAEITNSVPNGKKKLDGVSHLRNLEHLVRDHQQYKNDPRKQDPYHYNKDNPMSRTAISISEPPPPPPPREEIFIGYAGYNQKWYGPAIRYQNWKLIQGSSGGPQSEYDNPDGTSQPAPGGIIEQSSYNNNHNDNTTIIPYLLFDLSSDPGELHDVAKDHLDIVQLLREKLREYQTSYVPPLAEYDVDHCFRTGVGGSGGDSYKDHFPGIIDIPPFGPTWQPWCSQVIVYT